MSWRKMKEETLIAGVLLGWRPRRDSWRRKIILMLMLVLLMLMLMVWPLKSERGDGLVWSRSRLARSSTHGPPVMVRPWKLFNVSSVEVVLLIPARAGHRPAPRRPRARHRPALLLFTPAPPRRPGPSTSAWCIPPPFRAPPAHQSRLHSPPPRPRPRHRPAVSRSSRARPRAPPRPPTLVLMITALGLIVRPKHLVGARA